MCFAEVFYRSVLQNCFTEVFYRSVLQSADNIEGGGVCIPILSLSSSPLHARLCVCVFVSPSLIWPTSKGRLVALSVPWGSTESQI